MAPNLVAQNLDAQGIGDDDVLAFPDGDLCGLPGFEPSLDGGVGFVTHFLTELHGDTGDVGDLELMDGGTPRLCDQDPECGNGDAMLCAHEVSLSRAGVANTV